MDALELLRRQNPETEAFFAGRPDEPFFVKSLENIQGDERDVIFISVAYGRDAQGQFTMNFGPLSREGEVVEIGLVSAESASSTEKYEEADFRRTHSKRATSPT